MAVIIMALLFLSHSLSLPQKKQQSWYDSPWRRYPVRQIYVKSWLPEARGKARESITDKRLVSLSGDQKYVGKALGDGDLTLKLIATELYTSNKPHLFFLN